MAASGSKDYPPLSLEPPKISITERQNPNPNPNPSASTIPPILPSQEEIAISCASHITFPELIRRRSRHRKQLKRCYKEYYWALMEELKIKYKEYYWMYGVSPFKEEHPSDRDASGVAEVNDKNNNNVNNNTNGGTVAITRTELDDKKKLQCSFSACKTKAMALTSFCHLHILSDSKQKLYKPCGYVIKSAQAGPITCMKPILRTAAPSLCTLHFQMAQKSVKRALKKAGLNMSSSNKLAPKFHVIVAEYIRQIQAIRRAAKRENGKKVAIKEETAD